MVYAKAYYFFKVNTKYDNFHLFIVSEWVLTNYY